ncbi:MAG: YeeE/YedE family protein [Gemmatimonadaceae bacterium]|nr:YeeE/YedE family protein [Gemmatimonadaceae bacterium]
MSTTSPRSLPEWARLAILFGALGALSILLVAPIGVSGTYPRAIGEVLRLVAPAVAAQNAYLEKVGRFLKPESMLVIGLVIGAFLAARTGRAPRAKATEPIHASETTNGRRYLNTFVGGFLIVFGARIAGGCTSGHVISGITQLSMSGFLFAAGVFATGLLTARLIRRGGY